MLDADAVLLQQQVHLRFNADQAFFHVVRAFQVLRDYLLQVSNFKVLLDGMEYQAGKQRCDRYDRFWVV